MAPSARITCAALVLAAGAGRRMGGPKAVLRVDPAGATLLELAIALATSAELNPVVVVLDPDSPSWPEAMTIALSLDATIVENPDAARGMLSSVRLGLDALPAGVTHAALMPVDHAGIRLETLKTLLTRAAARPDAIVVPSFDGKRGHPGIFPASLFTELRAASDEEGARAIVRKDPSRVEHVVVTDPATVRDLDTPADLKK